MRHFMTSETRPDGRAYGWMHAEPDHALWRYGRAHLIIPGAGRVNYQGTDRGDLHLNAEWSVGTKYRFGFGGDIKIGTNASEQDIAIGLHALGVNLYLSTEQLIPRRWLSPHRDESRVTGFRLAKDHGEFQVWHPRDSHRRDTPWYRYSYVNWDRMLFGNPTVDTEVIEQGTTVVPMPERIYDATYEIHRSTRRWTKRLGRLRPADVNYRTDIRPLDPVPVPGKGENSWDCDDDALYSILFGGRSVEKAVASLVESALSTRRRHGGQHMSITTDGAP